MADHTVEEYKTLRDEIARYDTNVFNIMVANIAVLGALVGYGLNSKNPFVFLAPFAVMLPSMHFIAWRKKAGSRAAAYICIFLERELGLHWETRLDSLRRSSNKKAKAKVGLAILWFFIAASLVCFGLGFFYQFTSEKVDARWPFVVMAVLILAFAIWSIKRLNKTYIESHDTYNRAWSEIKDEESRSGFSYL